MVHVHPFSVCEITRGSPHYSFKATDVEKELQQQALVAFHALPFTVKLRILLAEKARCGRLYQENQRKTVAKPGKP